jgi:hypothetical protein
MGTPFTVGTPRYYIKNIDGDLFDIFKQKNNAISSAIKMAIEYPANEFIVLKSVNNKEKEIFKISINIKTDLINLPEVYENMIDMLKIKVSNLSFWRKKVSRKNNEVE